MKHTLFLLLPLAIAGCASQADYEPAADHPAYSGRADSAPPTAADPFAVEGRPIESEADPDQGGVDPDAMAGDMSGMPGMDAATQPAADAYPLDTCPVTGATLGSMGEPIDVEVKGRIVKVCCPGCVETVKADPDKYLALLDQAEQGGE